jgi:DNA-directed RNA polymerase specialized sigma24 family protein
MHDELSVQPELASDLEWLLLSGQTNPGELLLHLVDDIGAGLHLLMQCMFDDAEAADNAMVETLTEIVLNRNRYQSDKAVKVWLFSLALDTAWQLRRGWKRGLAASISLMQDGSRLSLKQTDSIPEWMEYLPEQSRLITLLNRYIGLEQNEIAQVLGIPDFLVAQNLEILDRTFPAESSAQKLVFAAPIEQHVLEATLQKLSVNQPRGKLRRNLLEMSWVIGAVFLVALLTQIYDRVNPDPVRQALEFSILTPLPTSIQEPMPTASPTPWLDMGYSSDEIALRYWQRWQHINTIWIDYLIMLGGAQGGTNGYTISRVELAWDLQTGNKLVLVGAPEGPPVYGFYSDNRNTYELDIRYGRLSAATILDNSRPNYWLYLVDLALNLQMNNFEGNWTFEPAASGSLVDRDTLIVKVINSDGFLENTTVLDSITGIPLIQQRYRFKGERNYLVLYAVVNDISVDESIPVEHFSIENSRQVKFRSNDLWIDNPRIENNLSWWKRIFTDQAASDIGENLVSLLNYQVFALPREQGIKYSTGVIAENVLVGEYPMGNPWSVLCERSPDGSRVAFIEDRRFEYGSTFPSNVLHWFSIDNPGVLQTPLPDVDATRLTFSPDSQFLAVHASNEVSIIELSSGKVERLLLMPSVDRLVFSENGRYLGVLQSSIQTAGATIIYIVDLITKEIVETLHLEPDQDWVSQRADIFATKQVDFTRSVFYGLENCR